MRTSRRDFIRLTASAVALSTTSISAFAADRTVKIGTLKLIHGVTPYFYE
jgi:NitT/TauT family transport system substrate-binding protein